MFAEDLTLFLNDFGVDAVFTRELVEVASAKVILDAPPQDVAVYDRSFYDEKFYAAKVQGADILLYGRAVDLVDIETNDGCAIDGIDYYVIAAQPDGSGMMFVNLSMNRA